MTRDLQNVNTSAKHARPFTAVLLVPVSWQSLAIEYVLQTAVNIAREQPGMTK